ncbi:NAD-dependent epimerase/dehydratase family protein [Paenibacillus flagellatus]|uniref:Nucleoside-diphosphate sugar epimerase n=1 Tax=Paenibacillus flagellatus TaxID=2211139 RepID=A0A2V5KW27_9BACL|nr:NAD-dependent epimerase/dehydratase family protein [Paenibacillus flagellatus]PYI53836.1 nucleoside-diphosphate sugar epimerase [Paenibacillus flagellatus]
MRVLVTGGYGFIGSFVAERFYKEGYEVSIIDSLATGSRQNVTFKHKSYTHNVEDRKCEEIFRSSRFDIVVHLAAQVNVGTSVDDPRLDTKSNVLGLSNILSLSQKYGVKKLIFASSAAVYGENSRMPLTEEDDCEPISPYGLNKWIGETYCRKWHEIYGLETICFRFSNVYGPRQGNGGEGGVVSIFTERALSAKELIIYGDGGQTRDFIYVEDVADAIYRASYSYLTGVYNLSSNTETSVNDLVDTIRSLHGDVRTAYRDGRPGDIYRSRLDNAKIRRDLDWAPKYSIQEGLRKTFDWFAANRSPEPAEKKAPRIASSPAGKWAKATKPFVENVLAFGVTAWMTLSLRDSMYDLIDIRLIYIIVLGIIYGNRQSITAVALSVLLYVYEQLDSGRELISLLQDSDFYFYTAIYLFVGLVVGYAIDMKNAAVQSIRAQKEALEEKYAFLTDVYNDTREVKEQLQHQVMNSADSFGKIHAVTKELESLEPEKIFASTVGVLESVMRAEVVAIYSVNKYKTYLRLMSRSDAGGSEMAKSIRVEEVPYVRQVVLEKKLFVNKELQEDAPLMAAPVISNGEVVAVIALSGMKFEHFTLYHQNVFKITVDLISSSFSRALAFVEATVNQRYIEGTPVLKPEVFESILEAKQTAKSNHGIDYVLLEVEAGPFAAQSLPARIAQMLRETDYIGIGKDGKLMVLLSNSSAEDASRVLERFKENGITVHAAEEDVHYV